MRRMSLFVAALCALLLNCRPQSVVNLPTVLDADSYAFYSSLYRNSSSLQNREVLGIAIKPFELVDKQYCFKPSTSEDREMAVAASKPETRNFAWEAKFDLQRPYVLIPEQEIVRAVDCVGQKYGQRPVSDCERYGKLSFVRFLSVPIFNKDHTRALVGIGRSCGGLCGDGSIKVYRKNGPRWEREKNSFASCGWEA